MTDGRQRRRLTATVTDLEVQRQRALVVGVALPQHDQGWAERSLDELELLTETAGSEPVDAVLLNRKAPEPATFIDIHCGGFVDDSTRAGIDRPIADPLLEVSND